MKSNNGIAGVGLLTAIAASLCCITPVIALIAGTSGMASTFSWLEPARPLLIGLTILALGFAWYQKLKPQKVEADCDTCAVDEKPGFMQSKLFLGIITVFSAVMLTFPYYSHVFYSGNMTTASIADENAAKTVFTIEGMTCESCEDHVNHEIHKLEGIGETEVSYPKGTAIVVYDHTKVNRDKIKKAINSTGYKVTNTEDIDGD